MVRKKLLRLPRWRSGDTLGITFVFTLFLLGETMGGKPRQQFANEPSPQTAVLGSTVVLPCRIIHKVGELQWTRDGFGLGNERELFAFKRYKMIGANEEGDFSLKISPLTLEDDAEFQCQVTGWKDVRGVRSQTAKLTVYVQPEAPEILQGSLVNSTAGAGVQLECISKGGKPAAEIQWLDSSGREIKDGVKYQKQLLKDGHRFDVRSTLTFIANREHHNGVFTCTATNPAVNQPLRTQVRLEVKYPPQITISHDKQNGYKEGDTAVLTCLATANPNQLTFKWFRGDKLISDKNETRLIIKDITRDANLEDITCEVTNAVSTSKKMTRLDVHYGPTFRVDPKNVFAEEGENVTLKCQVDGSPPPKIVWIPQKNSSFIYGTGPTLSLTASKDTVGSYQCLAKVEDFTEISTTIGLFLKGPPEIRADRQQWGTVGDTSLIECFIPSATPNSVEISWFHGGKEIDFVNGRYDIEKEITSDGFIVRLVIKRAKIEDFDTYNCSVQNAFGTDMVDIVLRRKKVITPYLVVGVFGAIVFILIVAIAVIYFGRRSASKKRDAKNGGLPEKSISLQLNDQNSTGNESDLKIDLDNRTGSSLSAKDCENDQSWDKEEANPVSPTYLSNTSSYLSPENFTNNPMKLQNGHGPSYANNLTYGNYSSPPDVLKPSAQQLGANYIPMGGSFSPRTHAPILTSSPHQMYPVSYHIEPQPQPTTDPLEGLRGLSSSAYTNGFSKNTSTLPLSLHVNRTPTNTPSVGIPPVPVNTTSTIPRLGIPVDPSQYIVPPRTQILQGTLATHV